MPEMPQELPSVVAGVATVELAHEVTSGVFNEAQAAGLHFTSTEVPSGLTHFIEGGIDAAQGIAFPVATALLVAAGLRMMLQPFLGNRKRGRA